MSEPKQESVRAIDVIPYHWAVWCSIGSGKPFANTIEHVSWSEDGRKIWFMLGTHNFYSAGPDEMVELVPLEPSPYGSKSGHRAHEEFLKKRPTPEQVALIDQKLEIEARLSEVNARLARETP